MTGGRMAKLREAMHAGCRASISKPAIPRDRMPLPAISLRRHAPSPSFQRKLESSAFGFLPERRMKVAGFQLSLE